MNILKICIVLFIEFIFICISYSYIVTSKKLQSHSKNFQVHVKCVI